MSIPLIAQLEMLQQDNLQKDLTISTLSTKLATIQVTNSYLQGQISSLTEQIQSLKQDLDKLSQESIHKSAEISSLQSLTQSLKSDLDHQEKLTESFNASQFSNDSSELNKLKMLYYDLESKYAKNHECFLQQEKSYKERIQELISSNTKNLFEKRKNWLDTLPVLESLPVEKVFNDISSQVVINKKESDPVSIVLEDVEKLLGWKIQYKDNELFISAANRTILIKKQEFSDHTYYNIELCPDLLPLLVDSEFNDLLFSHQNFPVFFASVLKMNS